MTTDELCNKREGNNLKNMLEKYLKRFCWVPLALGVAGYLYGGEADFLHALYASAALYFINPVSDADNLLIMLAKFTALIVTAGAIIVFVRTVAERLRHFFVRLSKDASVVYTDNGNEYANILAESLRKGYLVEEPGRIERVRNHMLLFRDDQKTLDFFTEYKGRFAGTNVYLILRTLDPFFLCDTADTNIHYMSIYDLVARKFWKEHDLYDAIIREKRKLRVAFPEFDPVSGAMFKYAYLNNVYASGQDIEYHIWGADQKDGGFLSGLDTMGLDRIVLYEDSWEKDTEKINGMDMIILTGTDMLSKIQTFIRFSAESRICCFDDKDTIYEDIIANDRIETFGGLKDILSEKEVINETLNRNAKLFNYDYELRAAGKNAGDDYETEAEEAWKRLNGFLRGSNIARADHHWIEKRLLADGIGLDEVQKVEHIRWSRYHYYNGWKYAPKRDNSKKHHHLLIPYEDLEEKEKVKDDVYDPLLREEIENNL